MKIKTSIFKQSNIEKSAAPIAKDPVSPIKIRAFGRLKIKNEKIPVNKLRPKYIT